MSAPLLFAAWLCLAPASAGESVKVAGPTTIAPVDAEYIVELPGGFDWEDFGHRVYISQGGKGLMIDKRSSQGSAGLRSTVERTRRDSMKAWKSDATPVESVRLPNGEAHYFIGYDEQGRSGLFVGMLGLKGGAYTFDGHPMSPDPSSAEAMGSWIKILGLFKPRRGGGLKTKGGPPPERRPRRKFQPIRMQ